MPLKQTSLTRQALPQVPQLGSSHARSAQAPAQSVEHPAHTPLVQVSLARQALPQEPQ
jgi:hypothetical protein